MKDASHTAWIEYWYVLWIVAALSALGFVANYFVGYHSVGFLFLCGILALGLFYSLGPVLLAAALSALAWDYLFISPQYTLTISSSEDIFMIVTYFLAAVITGLLTARVRRNQQAIRIRERRAQLLYQLVSRMAAGGQERTLVAISSLLVNALGRDFAVFLLGQDGELVNRGYAAQPFQLSELEIGQARKALEACAPWGWSSAHEPGLALRYMPLMTAGTLVGLLVCRPHGGPLLTGEEEELLQAASHQLALSLERERLQGKSRETDLLRKSEQLHQTLLNSISHELRTPLTALLGSAAALQDDATAADPASRRDLLEEVAGAGERLNRVIENLLDMARLNSGVLALKKDWHDPAELVRLTLGRLKGPLSGHRIKLDLPEGLPLVHVDYRFMEHALSNLLLNAAAYAPADSQISVSARVAGGTFEISVADQGPGIPTESLEKVFDKFYRVPGSPTGGTGLGLYITQSLMRAHEGEARAANVQGGGAEFSLLLPLEKQPAAPAEAA